MRLRYFQRFSNTSGCITPPGIAPAAYSRRQHIVKARDYIPKNAPRPHDEQILAGEMGVSDLKRGDKTEALIVRYECRDGTLHRWISPFVRPTTGGMALGGALEMGGGGGGRPKGGSPAWSGQNFFFGEDIRLLSAGCNCCRRPPVLGLSCIFCGCVCGCFISPRFGLFRIGHPFYDFWSWTRKTPLSLKKNGVMTILKWSQILDKMKKYFQR